MWKQLLIMALVLVALMVWDYGLAERTQRAREESVRLERLLDVEVVFSEERPIAAYRLDQGDGTVHLYIHDQGVWRCLTAYGALAINDQIDMLFPKVAAAQGLIRTRNPQTAQSYGFDTPEVLTFSLCGPDVLTDPMSDVIYAIDLGHSIPATGGSYVRPVGSDEIWEINVDFREELATEPGIMLPPMVDRRIFPRGWPGFRSPGVDRIVIELPDELPLELQRHDRDLTPELRAGGADPWEWTVKRGDNEYSAHPFQMYTYGQFIMMAEYAGILSPMAHTPQTLGFNQPRARITLRSANGQVMQLIVGHRAPRGGVAVLNTYTENVFEVVPDIVDMMLPEMDMLLVEELGNPWDSYRRNR